MSLEKWHSAWWRRTPGNPCLLNTASTASTVYCINSSYNIYNIYLQYSAMMDSEALRVRLFVAQSRLRHSQGSDWYISLDIFVLENTKNQAHAQRIPALRCIRRIIIIQNNLSKCSIIFSSGNSTRTVSDFFKRRMGWPWVMWPCTWAYIPTG